MTGVIMSLIKAKIALVRKPLDDYEHWHDIIVEVFNDIEGGNLKQKTREWDVISWDFFVEEESREHHLLMWRMWRVGIIRFVEVDEGVILMEWVKNPHRFRFSKVPPAEEDFPKSWSVEVAVGKQPPELVKDEDSALASESEPTPKPTPKPTPDPETPVKSLTPAEQRARKRCPGLFR
jgi:hypothetical protein